MSYNSAFLVWFGLDCQAVIEILRSGVGERRLFLEDSWENAFQAGGHEHAYGLSAQKYWLRQYKREPAKLPPCEGSMVSSRDDFQLERRPMVEFMG